MKIIVLQDGWVVIVNNWVKKIAIVGRDADAWITALLLQNMLEGTEPAPQIELIELAPELTPQDSFSVLPSHKILHNILGANERAVLKAAKGHFTFGQQFSGWCAGAEPYMHAYDGYGLDFDGVDFYQYWLKATQSGLKIRIEDFNLGAVAAKQQRYVVFPEGVNTFSRASCGYHLNAIEYVKTVAQAAVTQGVKRTPGEVAQVNRKDDKIPSIILTDGREISADFFIDASGVEAVLIKTLETDNIVSWSQWLPANRILVASAPALGSLPSFARISAFREGWFGLYPLLDRTAVNLVYSTEYLSAEELVSNANLICGLPLTDATDNAFAAGTRKKHWIGNCLALGDAAVSLEPLDAVQLHPLHIGLSLLRNLYPNRAENMPEADIYNQKMTGFIENIRDYQIAHYHLNKRFNDPYWNQLRQRVVPNSLQAKIDLFNARGLIALNEDETFLQEDWLALFNGQKLQPRSYDPRVNKISDDLLITKFQSLLSHIKNEVEQMPNMQAYVELNLI